VKLDISQAELARISCRGLVLSGLGVHADVTSARELPGDPEIGAGAAADLTHGVSRTEFQIGSITIELALAVKPLLLVGAYAQGVYSRAHGPGDWDKGAAFFRILVVSQHRLEDVNFAVGVQQSGPLELTPGLTATSPGFACRT
jgi:hypothetical protein